MNEGVGTDPALVANLVTMFKTVPSTDQIRNLHITMTQCEVEGIVIPLSISDRGANCYICNPSAAYIDYAIEETRHIAVNAALKPAHMALIGACRPS